MFGLLNLGGGGVRNLTVMLTMQESILKKAQRKLVKFSQNLNLEIHSSRVLRFTRLPLRFCEIYIDYVLLYSRFSTPSVTCWVP